MARATNVYLVDPCMRAFTVKHECQTWLRDRFDPGFVEVTVIRIPDGGEAPTATISLADFLSS